MFLNNVFLQGGVVSTSPDPQAGGPPLVGCPRLLIQFIRSYPPYRRPFLHPQPEDAPCRGDRDPLTHHGAGVVPLQAVRRRRYTKRFAGGRNSKIPPDPTTQFTFKFISRIGPQSDFVYYIPNNLSTASAQYRVTNPPKPSG